MTDRKTQMRRCLFAFVHTDQPDSSTGIVGKKQNAVILTAKTET